MQFPLWVLSMKWVIVSFLVFTCFAWLSSVQAASLSFDGNIERDPYSYHDWHTLDFISIDMLSPGKLVVLGTGGTLLDFNFGVYVLGSIVDGRQRLNLAPNLSYFPISETSQRIECDATPGRYVIGVDPNASDWDTMDGMVGYFSSDGEPEHANGTYHLEITGDFSLYSIREGSLPGSIPEPTVWYFTGSCLAGLSLRRRRRTSFTGNTAAASGSRPGR